MLPWEKLAPVPQASLLLCWLLNSVGCLVCTAPLQVEGLLRQQQLAEGGTAVAGSSSTAAAAGRAGCTGSAMLLRSTPQALMCIWQREGWRVLFAGLSINYMKVCWLGASGLCRRAFCRALLLALQCVEWGCSAGCCLGWVRLMIRTVQAEPDCKQVQVVLEPGASTSCSLLLPQ